MVNYRETYFIGGKFLLASRNLCILVPGKTLLSATSGSYLVSLNPILDPSKSIPSSFLPLTLFFVHKGGISEFSSR